MKFVFIHTNHFQFITSIFVQHIRNCQMTHVRMCVHLSVCLSVHLCRNNSPWKGIWRPYADISISFCNYFSTLFIEKVSLIESNFQHFDYIDWPVSKDYSGSSCLCSPLLGTTDMCPLTQLCYINSRNANSALLVTTSHIDKILYIESIEEIKRNVLF